MDQKYKETNGETPHPQTESDEEEEGDIDGVLSKLLEIRDQCQDKAKKNISEAQEKQKKQYDSKHNTLKVYIILHSYIYNNYTTIQYYSIYAGISSGYIAV